MAKTALNAKTNTITHPSNIEALLLVMPKFEKISKTKFPAFDCSGLIKIETYGATNPIPITSINDEKTNNKEIGNILL